MNPVSKMNLISGAGDHSMMNGHDVRSESLTDRSDKLQVVFKDLRMVVTKMVPVSKRPCAKKIPEEKEILHGLSGVFQPGHFSAIMGASGAGKTSLLNAVAGNLDGYSGATVSGEVLVNGVHVPAKMMRKLSGFVFQDDVILDTMTVREAVAMSALLRLPNEVNVEDKMIRVDEAISILHLDKAKNTQVGSPHKKGISGGERKRTSVAMEMVTNPSILFLDEPTSGLDTFTAYSVIYTLTQLAKSGRTLIATIHQPSSDIYHLFDDLLLLSGGNVLYNGNAARCIDYFANLGYQCPKFTNPADYYFMSVINDVKTDVAGENSIATLLKGVKNGTHLTLKDVPASTTTSTMKNTNMNESVEVDVSHLARRESDAVVVMDPADRKAAHQSEVDALVASWPTSAEGQAMMNHVANPLGGKGPDYASLKDQAPFSVQFNLLMKRSWHNSFRNPLIVKAKFGQTLFMALLLGLLYLQLGLDQEDIQNRQGALFFVTVNGLFSATMAVITIFGGEKPVFQREHGNGFYGLPAYFFSKLLVELPFQIVFPLLFVSIYYFMVGFQAVASKFFIACLIMIAMTLCGMALGIFLAASFNDLAVAMTVLPAIILPLMLFGGLFTQADSIPVFFSWIKFISPIFYGYSANMQNEMTGLVFNCPPNSTLGCIQTGEQVIARLSFDQFLTISENIIVLFAMFFVLVACGYLNLWRIVRH